MPCDIEDSVVRIGNDKVQSVIKWVQDSDKDEDETPGRRSRGLEAGMSASARVKTMTC